MTWSNSFLCVAVSPTLDTIKIIFFQFEWFFKTFFCLTMFPHSSHCPWELVHYHIVYYRPSPVSGWAPWEGKLPFCLIHSPALASSTIPSIHYTLYNARNVEVQMYEHMLSQQWAGINPS